MKNLFKIGEKLPYRTALIIEVAGFVFFILFWWLITSQGWVESRILPSPIQVFASYADLAEQEKQVVLSEKFVITDNALNAMRSDSVSANVISTIEKLNGQQYGTEKKLDKILLTQLDSTDYAQSEFLIKKHTRIASVMTVSSLIFNTFYSITLNIFGYLEAILFSLLVGFLIALIPFFRSLLSRYIDAIRFVPLAAVTGLFIAWFGIELNMKVQFLAFGIFVFLLPVVIQRIYEVDKIYLQTSYTLGASAWQTIRYVYWPHVISKLIDDIRVLTAISWTYIIVAEMVNSDGGIGTLIFLARRFSRLDQVFALLLLIIVIGFLQDIFFGWLDRKINPHKYV